MPSISVKGKTVQAFIFDWDGIFVDTELLKAWTYGLGVHEACLRLGCALPEDLQEDFPAGTPHIDHPFVQVCGRWVGRSREDYADGLVRHYQLADSLNRQREAWVTECGPRIESLKEERRKSGVSDEPPYHPWEVLYELRRPHYEQVKESIEPISANIEFLERLPSNVQAALVTRTKQDDVVDAMRRFNIPVDRFACLVCRPQKDITKAAMYEEAARTMGVLLDACAAVEDTQVGIEEARKARGAVGEGVGVVIASPTKMTWVQFPDVVLDSEDRQRWRAVSPSRDRPGRLTPPRS